VFTYDIFIEEIRELLREGKELRNSKQRDQDPKFRKWRLKLEDAIKKIKGQGFEINCRSSYRTFSGDDHGYNIPTEEDLNNSYNQELEDTLNELGLIVEHFDKYGITKIKVEKSTNLEPGHIPTILELWLAMKVHHGWKAISAILVFFGLIIVSSYQLGKFIESNSQLKLNEKSVTQTKVENTSNNAMNSDN